MSDELKTFEKNQDIPNEALSHSSHKPNVLTVEEMVSIALANECITYDEAYSVCKATHAAIYGEKK